MDSQYASEMQSGMWTEMSPDECPCHGRGYMFDDFDCDWRCGIHGVDLGVGVPPHPEDDDGRATFDLDRHVLLARRAAYRAFREQSGLPALDFHATVMRRCKGSQDAETILATAKLVRDAAVYLREEEQALRAGFSCALESRWADEAARERRERR